MDIVGVQQALALAKKQLTPAATTQFGATPVDRASGVVKGIRYLIAYGNSEFSDNGNSAANAWDRMLATIRPQQWFNGAVNGATVADVNAYAFGTVVGQRAGGSTGTSQLGIGPSTFGNRAFAGALLLLKLVRNDSRRDAVVTGSESVTVAQAKSRTGFQRGTEALLRLARAAYRIPNLTSLSATTTLGSPVVACASITAGLQGMPVSAASGIPAGSYVGTVIAGVSFRLSSSPSAQVDVNAIASGAVTANVAPHQTGSWAGTNSSANTNGTVVFSSTNGSTLTYSFVLAAPAHVTWVTLGLDDDALGLVGAAYTVAADGGAAIASTTSRQSKRSGTGYSFGFGQVCTDLGVLTAGPHSIVVTHNDTTGRYLYDDCLLVESATPMTTIAVKAYQLPAAGYTAVGGSWAVDQAYNGLLDTLAALFPTDQSVITVDPNETGSGYNSATMIGATDGLATHLNDTGEQWMHDWLMSKINALTGRLGLNRPT